MQRLRAVVGCLACCLLCCLAFLFPFPFPFLLADGSDEHLPPSVPWYGPYPGRSVAEQRAVSVLADRGYHLAGVGEIAVISVEGVGQGCGLAVLGDRGEVHRPRAFQMRGYRQPKQALEDVRIESIRPRGPDDFKRGEYVLLGSASWHGDERELVAWLNESGSLYAFSFKGEERGP